jgi:demethoxyubiquinone hydroxylase (CLK1/Coq7/Cat5 family)
MTTRTRLGLTNLYDCLILLNDLHTKLNAETERQVSLHLQDHLNQLPAQDERSRKILEQMNEDELHHRHTALEAGGVETGLIRMRSILWFLKIITGFCH